jgi:hypothetical protein
MYGVLNGSMCSAEMACIVAEGLKVALFSQAAVIAAAGTICTADKLLHI